MILGSSHHDQGGIGSVFRIYKNQGFLKDKCYLVSHQKGPLGLRLYTFSTFFIQYIHHLLTNRRLKIIHAHLSQRGSFFRKALILMIGKLFRKKVIYHLHGSEFLLFFRSAPKPVQQFIRKVLKSCDAIIVLSHSWKTNLSEVTENPNIHVVYNPIVITDTPKVYPPFYVEKPHFLFLGNIGKRKGVYDLIEAVQKIRNPNFVISLYGDGEVEEVRTKIEKLGLQDIIQVHGWISGTQKAEAFKSAQLLLLPSHNEGLPISILEALSMGMPVLSTTVGGIPEAVEHNRNGLLIQPGDTTALAYYLEKIANSPDLLRNMSENAYQTARQRFDHQLIFEQMETLYQSILSLEPYNKINHPLPDERHKLNSAEKQTAKPS